MWYKQIENGYIVAIGTGGSNTQITEAEYNQIMAIIQSKPPKTETTDYRMKEDLTWEEFELPPVEETEPDDSELLDILLGGAT